MARKYQHTLELLPQIKEMLTEGKTQKQIKETQGLTGKRPVHYLLSRERKKEIQGIAKQRGRKPAKTLAEYKYEKSGCGWKINCCWAEISRQMPNKKWVTDISYIHTSEGVLYLSMDPRPL